MVVTLKITLPWDIVPCGLVTIYQYFEGTCCRVEECDMQEATLQMTVAISSKTLKPDYISSHSIRQESSSASHKDMRIQGMCHHFPNYMAIISMKFNKTEDSGKQ
jgi:hypothetical protein